ncbi:MAG: hypothetical protein SGPRY_008484, partial [Prymnesium sp.]
TSLPYVEVYQGSKLIEATSVPLTNLEILSRALGEALEAAERELSSRWRREKARLLAIVQVGPHT